MERRYNWINLYRVLDFIFYNKDKIIINNLRHEKNNMFFMECTYFRLSILGYNFSGSFKFDTDKTLIYINLTCFYGHNEELVYFHKMYDNYYPSIKYNSDKSIIECLQELYPIIKKHKFQGSTIYKFFS